MKQFNILSLVLLVLAAGCTQTKKKTAEKDELNMPAAKLERTQNYLIIVPGKSVDKIHIGQDMQDVFKLLGDADDGDSAMGKAWAIWHLKTGSDTLSKGDLSVYSSYKDTSMMAKDVKQIVVSAGNYSTVKGIRNGISLDSIKSVYPKLKKAATYIDKTKKDTLTVYDEQNEGIAFDVKSKDGQLVSTAITVHPPKISVNSTYLTIHRGWEKTE